MKVRRDANYHSQKMNRIQSREDNQTNSFMLFVFSVMGFHAVFETALVMLHFRIAIHLEGDRKNMRAWK